MNDHGFVVCVYNRTTEKVDQFLANEAKGERASYASRCAACLLLLARSFCKSVGTKVIGSHSLQEMVSKLKKPRRVMMLVKAGSAVDSFIDQLLPLLEKGDIIIDGGNSEYTDSIVRCDAYIR